MMATLITGIVKDGVVVPSVPLPEGTFVEIHLHDATLAVPPELQEELNAWDRASDHALDVVERLAEEMDSHEKR